MKIKLPPVYPEGKPPSPHHARLLGGKYRDQLLTRVPVGYLRWAVQNEVELKVELDGGRVAPLFQVAKVEIERRGERLGEIEVSPHAIDRLSERFLGIWHEHGAGTGLYSWAERAALEAWEKRHDLEAQQQEDGAWQIPWKGIVWVIEELVIPCVKTVK